MSLLDMALGLAESKSDVIAKVLNKSPQQVRGAISQGKKLLPEILNDPSAEGGAKVLSDLGVDKSFIESAFQKFGNYGSKVGLNKSSIKSAVDNLERAMDKNKQLPSGTPRQKKSSGFESSKYPRV